MSKEPEQKKFGRLYLLPYKKSVVEEVEREGGAIKMVATRHDLSSAAVALWMKSYGSEQYKSTLKKRWTDAERNKIVREIISGRATTNQVHLKYSIHLNTLFLWLRKYRKANPELSDPAVQDPGNAEKDSRLIEMEKELEMAKLKVRALEVMVDIASDQFKVDIRKKFGAKQ